ncbi:putative zinc-binding protein [Cytophagaceae bacterium ABcell3]|nr:putative zinc-binding protein [Cytophagaceae bacterium ABcell3]
MTPKNKIKKPVVFACSGCSDAGKTSYNLAQYLNEKGTAEMSCLAGISAEIPVFLKKVINRPIWIIDGCPIQCAKSVMEKLQLQENYHIQLRDFGIKKYDNKDTDLEDLSAEVIRKAPNHE